MTHKICKDIWERERWITKHKKYYDIKKNKRESLPSDEEKRGKRINKNWLSPFFLRFFTKFMIKERDKKTLTNIESNKLEGGRFLIGGENRHKEIICKLLIFLWFFEWIT